MPRFSRSVTALRRALVFSLLFHVAVSALLLRAAPPAVRPARPATLLEVTLDRSAPRPQRFVQVAKRLKRQTVRRPKPPAPRRTPHSLEVALAPKPVATP